MVEAKELQNLAINIIRFLSANGVTAFVAPLNGVGSRTTAIV
jgi:hypothetical protein